VSGGVGSASCSTGEDDDGETRPNSRGLRGGGGWPSSPWMAHGSSSGGVRRGPKLLGHHRWMGGVEGGAVEERTWHVGVDERDRAHLLWLPGGSAEGKGQGVWS
jgi:hypothetical protein